MYALGNFSCYTFHGSLWEPWGLVRAAAEGGYTGVGLSDLRGFYGSVPFSQACRAHGLRAVHGCRVRVEGIGMVQLTVRNEAGYRALSAALTRWNERMREGGGREVPPVTQGALGALWEGSGDDLLLSFPGTGEAGEAAAPVHHWLGRFGRLARVVGRESIWVELGWHTEAERGLQRGIYRALRGEGEAPPRFVVQTGARLPAGTAFDRLEVLQSIGTLTLRGQAHPEKLSRGDYALPRREELQERFAKAPEVLLDTAEFASRADFDFTYGKLFMPHHEGRGGEESGPGYDREEEDYRRLRWLCYRGLIRNYAEGVYPWVGPGFAKPTRRKLRERIQRELAIVRETGYAGYFLIFHEIIATCGERGIPVLARGSAAGSLICYCLGVSNVCPFRFGLSFERFLNHERLRHSKLPDIDLDLPWDRRDEIIAYVYEKFGAEHVAMIGGFATFKARAAIAEVGKTLGQPESVVRRWTRYLPLGNLQKFARRRKGRVELRDLDDDEGFAEALELAMAFDGLPRHPMMHPCGIVVADRPLTEFTPLDPSNKGFRMTQMAMDPIEDLGLLKLDLLGQAGLSVLRDARRNIEEDAGLGSIEGGRSEAAVGDAMSAGYRDPAVFELVKTGNARGVFHIESPAMTNLLRLCRCNDIDCLVATVSVIRPGAANEDKKNLFARRYLGLEPPYYHHPDLEPILRESYGLMIYEEHILLVAHYWGGMGLGKADLLRRILVKKKKGAELEALGREFAACARRKGYSDEEIFTVWDMLVAFSGYMFNKAHGAAYAVEAYEGCQLKVYRPVHFLAAVLQNQRGFYAPLVYVLEAIRNGAVFELPDVNRPADRYRVETVEGRPRVTVPLWQIGGVSEGFLKRWHTAVLERGSRLSTVPGVAPIGREAGGAFDSWEDFLAAVEPKPSDLLLLARAGALRSFFPNRHQAVWEAARWTGKAPERNLLVLEETAAALPDLPPEVPRQNAEWEEEQIGFPVSVSPLDYWLEGRDRLGVIPAGELEHYVGQEVEVLGVVVASRSHQTMKGKPMQFLTLADATGFCEATVFPEAYQQYGYTLARARVLRARVLVERDGTGSGLSCQLVSVG